MSFRSSKQESWDDSAALYATIASKLPFYQDSARVLVDAAALRGGMTIADIGAGSTGLVINNIISACPEIGCVYAVDNSIFMLRSLECRVTSKKVKFVNCQAEDIDRHIKQKLNRIIANSVIWHFGIDKALVALRNILSDDGVLICNLAQWDVEERFCSRPSRYQFIDNELRGRGLPPKERRGLPLSLAVERFGEELARSGLKISIVEFKSSLMTDAHWTALYGLPAVARKSLPKLEQLTAIEILQSAMSKMGESQVQNNLDWVLITARAD